MELLINIHLVAISMLKVGLDTTWLPKLKIKIKFYFIKLKIHSSLKWLHFHVVQWNVSLLFFKTRSKKYMIIWGEKKLIIKKN